MTCTLTLCYIRNLIQNSRVPWYIKLEPYKPRSVISIVGTDWVDPEDPTVIAESELLGAANSIEAAAKKLAQLKPRRKAKVMGVLFYVA